YRLHVLPTEKSDHRFDFAAHVVLKSGRGTYEVVVGEPGRVPADPTYRLRDRDLSKTSIEFAAPGVAAKGRWTHSVDIDSAMAMGFGAQYDISAPSRRTHFVTPTYARNLALTWRGDLTVGQGNAERIEFGPQERHTAGGTTAVSFSRAAFGPNGTGTHGDDGSISVTFDPSGPASRGTYLLQSEEPLITGEVVLRRGEKVLATSKDPLTVSAADVPAEPATFSVRLAARHRLPWNRYATAVEGSWTFASQRPSKDAASLPMLDVRLDGPFDGMGRARAGRPAPLRLAVTGPTSPKIVSAPTLALSYDDGKTWAPVRLRAVGEVWEARPLLPPVAEGGQKYASYRVTAEDSEGNTVDVTAIRAFAVRRP
ncbi:MAG TPA: hypothetical protein VI076_12305, partial [Actinopolymorphaceae bacterium]